MKALTWFSCVMVSACAASVVIALVPHQGADAKVAVQPCGENAGWIESPPGHIACTLKNGKVINLRSVK